MHASDTPAAVNIAFQVGHSRQRLRTTISQTTYPPSTGAK